MEIVPDSKAKRDARSHHERLFDIREAFGVCKERAIRLNKVNECSITKIAEKAAVAKAYLTGNKVFAEPGVADKYREIGTEIILFREKFQQEKGLGQEDSEIEALKRELSRVKSSILPIVMELESEKNATSKWLKEIEKTRKTILLLQAELADLASNKANVSGIYSSSVIGIDRSVRTIISPDKYLFKNGVHRFDDEDARHEAWLKCYGELDEALSRDHPKRLYVLVGVPCSGKSTWAADALLFADRHSVVFDSTNLTRYEREYIALHAKRAKNVKKCCVFFDLPKDIIHERNLARGASGKVFSSDDLELMYEKLCPPEVHKETWIDEMIIVRG